MDAESSSVSSFIHVNCGVWKAKRQRKKSLLPGKPNHLGRCPGSSVIRVIRYMTSTTMHMNPGVPIMKSTNLWTGKLSTML